MLIVGLADIFDGDNNTPLSVQAEVAVNFGSENISVPAGDVSSNIVIQTAQPVTGSFRFRSVNAAILTSLTAGTNVVSDGAGNTAWRYIKESGVVATTTIELSNTVDLIAGDVGLQVVKRGGLPYEPTLAAATTGTVMYADADATLTFEAAENGNTFDVTYFTAETGGANRVFTLTPTALPPSRHYVVGMKTYDQYTGVFGTGGVVFDLAKVTRTSEAGPLGATVGDTSQIGFDWEAINTSSGDVKVYLPTEGVHQ